MFPVFPLLITLTEVEKYRSITKAYVMLVYPHKIKQASGALIVQLSECRGLILTF